MRPAAVSVTVDGVADDGLDGEEDNVGGDERDIESLVGTQYNDLLAGGPGSGTIDGGEGDDTVSAPGPNPHTLIGGDGNDTVSYAVRTAGVFVTLNARADDGEDGENDAVIECENIVGGAGSDSLSGDERANRLEGGLGSDTLEGGLGDDVLIGGPDACSDGDGYCEDEDAFFEGNTANGADILRGGLGVDRVYYSLRTAPLQCTLDGVANDGEEGEGDDLGDDLESIEGGSANDVLRGNDGENWLNGNGGDDRVFGLGGDDVLEGGAGTDAVQCGDGDGDICFDGAGCDNATCELQ